MSEMNEERGKKQGLMSEDSNVSNEGQTRDAWHRPVAVAKDRNVRAWMIFLGLLCFGVALWTPLRSLYYQYGYRKSEVEIVRDSDIFVALAYYGVNNEVLPGSQDITVEVFNQQLQLLKKTWIYTY